MLAAMVKCNELAEPCLLSAALCMHAQAHTTPAQSSNYGNFSTEVLWQLVDIMKKHGADFA
jgi:hypothetical protein